MITLPIEIYTDGSSRPKNPGNAAAAYIIRYWDLEEGSDIPKEKEIEFTKAFRLSTNNRMELLAGALSLKRVIELIKDGTFNGLKQLTLFSDSEYFINSLNLRWIDKWVQNNWMTSGRDGYSKPVKNRDIWEQIVEAKSELQSLNIILTFTHVKAHADNEYNNKCDLLAQTAASGTQFEIDEEYEKSLNEKR